MRPPFSLMHWPVPGPDAAATLAANVYSLSYMAMEAHAVITMRILGMAGFWPVTKTENKRMIDEKMSAMTEAQWAMWRAGLGFAAPATVFAAGLRPLRTKTRSNARRLSKRVFKARK